jgi:hypothetical protein
MTGHMRKRGANSWQLIVHLGHDDRGRRRSASKTVRGTKREAELALAELVTEVAKHALLPTASMPMEQIVRSSLEAKAPQLSFDRGPLRGRDQAHRPGHRRHRSRAAPSPLRRGLLRPAPRARPLWIVHPQSALGHAHVPLVGEAARLALADLTSQPELHIPRPSSCGGVPSRQQPIAHTRLRHRPPCKGLSCVGTSGQECERAELDPPPRRRRLSAACRIASTCLALRVETRREESTLDDGPLSERVDPDRGRTDELHADFWHLGATHRSLRRIDGAGRTNGWWVRFLCRRCPVAQG